MSASPGLTQPHLQPLNLSYLHSLTRSSSRPHSLDLQKNHLPKENLTEPHTPSVKRHEHLQPSHQHNKLFPQSPYRITPTQDIGHPSPSSPQLIPQFSLLLRTHGHIPIATFQTPKISTATTEVRLGGEKLSKTLRRTTPSRSRPARRPFWTGLPRRSLAGSCHPKPPRPEPHRVPSNAAEKKNRRTLPTVSASMSSACNIPRTGTRVPHTRPRSGSSYHGRAVGFSPLTSTRPVRIYVSAGMVWRPLNTP